MSKPKEISCEEALKIVFDYIDNELEHGRHEDMEDHLAKCHSCYSRVEFEKRLRAKIREAAGNAAPDSLRAKVGILFKDR